MEIALTILVAILSLLLGVMIVAYYRLRARTRDATSDAANEGEDPPERRATGPGLIAPADDEMDIPAALVGARCKEALEHFAPKLGLTPVNLLRAVLVQGLTGGRPITEELLEAIDELAALEPPSTPRPHRPN